ncbi:hypothetical protein HHK36_000015 [Tetracentron sinense]|uniref:Retrotransposon Copia-like N-terminal domain-containing protein n=1 Tax=Tetracentron sinense TaxID=13715 RepID=A0A834ZTC6_TETSI|nr:hypothetical protein HHK36_000015 [Tetracentron sinense]
MKCIGDHPFVAACSSDLRIRRERAAGKQALAGYRSESEAAKELLWVGKMLKPRIFVDRLHILIPSRAVVHPSEVEQSSRGPNDPNHNHPLSALRIKVRMTTRELKELMAQADPSKGGESEIGRLILQECLKGECDARIISRHDSDSPEDHGKGAESDPFPGVIISMLPSWLRNRLRAITLARSAAYSENRICGLFYLPVQSFVPSDLLAIFGQISPILPLMASSSNTMSHEINPGMKITTEPLNGSNYLYWSNAAKLFISSRSKLGHINGKNKAPNESSMEYNDWLSNNHLVMTWLLNSMEKNIARTFRFHTTAEGIWNMAKELYGEQNNIARTYQIKQELMSLKKGNKPFNEFVGELSSLFDELEFYVSLTVDAKELQKQKEQDKIFTLLAALPSDYEMFRSQILMASELPTFSSVCATIAREETRRKVMSSDLQENFEQSEKSALKNDSSSENIEKSFVANNNTASKGRGKGRKSRPYCTYCKKDGHVIDKCWKIHGKPDREKAKDIHVAQSADNETPLTMEKLAQFFNQFGKVNIASTSPSCDSGNPSSFLLALFSMSQQRQIQMVDGNAGQLGDTTYAGYSQDSMYALVSFLFLPFPYICEVNNKNPFHVGVKFVTLVQDYYSAYGGQQLSPYNGLHNLYPFYAQQSTQAQDLGIQYSQMIQYPYLPQHFGAVPTSVAWATTVATYNSNQCSDSNSIEVFHSST